MKTDWLKAAFWVGYGVAVVVSFALMIEWVL